jgi:hypothetical protein
MQKNAVSFDIVSMQLSVIKNFYGLGSLENTMTADLVLKKRSPADIRFEAITLFKRESFPATRRRQKAEGRQELFLFFTQNFFKPWKFFSLEWV